jgi:hypothetical protein
MKFHVEFHEEFYSEFNLLSEDVQDSILARAKLLSIIGPSLGRPYADTLSGSKFANMKELRFELGKGVWRVAFCFDPMRNAIILVAGDKRGANQKKFYNSFINMADTRYENHLKQIKNQ